MHRGKVHDTGGDQMTASSTAVIEIFNKNDAIRAKNGKPQSLEVRTPRLRVMVPFDASKVLEEDGSQVSPDFKLKRGEALTFKLKKHNIPGTDIIILYADDVRRENHRGIDAYFWNGFTAVLLGALTLLILNFVFLKLHSKDIFSIPLLDITSIKLLNFVSAVLMELVFSSFLLLIIWAWAGNRTLKGGAWSGFLTGAFIGLGISLYLMGLTQSEINDFETILNIIIEATVLTLFFAITFAATGAVIGKVLSRRSGAGLQVVEK